MWWYQDDVTFADEFAMFQLWMSENLSTSSLKSKHLRIFLGNLRKSSENVRKRSYEFRTTLAKSSEDVWDSMTCSSTEIRVMSLIGCFSVLNFRAIRACNNRRQPVCVRRLTNQRHYTDLCRTTSSVWNFSGRISAVSRAEEVGSITSRCSLREMPV